MYRMAGTIGGLVLLIGLALAGDWAQRQFGLAVPGAVLGLATYLLLLASGRFAWSLPGADLLIRLIGAMIVPPLVGLALFGAVLWPAVLPLALVLVISTGLTALATAMLFRTAGGRG